MLNNACIMRGDREKHLFFCHSAPLRADGNSGSTFNVGATALGNPPKKNKKQKKRRSQIRYPDLLLILPNSDIKTPASGRKHIPRVKVRCLSDAEGGAASVDIQIEGRPAERASLADVFMSFCPRFACVAFMREHADSPPACQRAE